MGMLVTGFMENIRAIIQKHLLVYTCIHGQNEKQKMHCHLDHFPQLNTQCRQDYFGQLLPHQENLVVICIYYALSGTLQFLFCFCFLW